MIRLPMIVLALGVAACASQNPLGPSPAISSRSTTEQADPHDLHANPKYRACLKVMKHQGMTDHEAQVFCTHALIYTDPGAILN